MQACQFDWLDTKRDSFQQSSDDALTPAQCDACKEGNDRNSKVWKFVGKPGCGLMGRTEDEFKDECEEVYAETGVFAQPKLKLAAHASDSIPDFMKKSEQGSTYDNTPEFMKSEQGSTPEFMKSEQANNDICDLADTKNDTTEKDRSDACNVCTGWSVENDADGSELQACVEDCNREMWYAKDTTECAKQQIEYHKARIAETSAARQNV